MFIFRAIARLFKAIGYLFKGKVDEARKALMTNPNVVQANYDEIIEEKTGRLATFKKAVGGLISQEERKLEKLKNLSEEVEKQEQLKAGAAARAKAVVARYNGDVEAVKKDPEYVKCQNAYRDFSSTLEAKQKMIDELEEDVENLSSSIQTHKISINTLLREIEGIKSEKHEAVAEIISSKEEKELADMLSGVAEDRCAKELQELRDTRRAARADARISREVAGLTAKQSEDEFLNYANVTVVDNEFDNLIGLPAPSETKAIEVQEVQPESVTFSPINEEAKEKL